MTFALRSMSDAVHPKKAARPKRLPHLLHRRYAVPSLQSYPIAVQPYDSLMKLTNCPINKRQTPTTDSSPLTITFMTLRRPFNRRRAVSADFPSRNDVKRRPVTDGGPQRKGLPSSCDEDRCPPWPKDPTLLVSKPGSTRAIHSAKSRRRDDAN